MKEGTKVKVVAQISGHKFEIGEIVERQVADYDNSEALGFFSETAGVWYMTPEEYEIAEKDYALDLLIQALHACQTSGFSRDVWETLCVAVDNAYREIEEDETD